MPVLAKKRATGQPVNCAQPLIQKKSKEELYAQSSHAIGVCATGGGTGAGPKSLGYQRQPAAAADADFAIHNPVACKPTDARNATRHTSHTGENGQWDA